MITTIMGVIIIIIILVLFIILVLTITKKYHTIWYVKIYGTVTWWKRANKFGQCPKENIFFWEVFPYRLPHSHTVQAGTGRVMLVTYQEPLGLLYIGLLESRLLAHRRMNRTLQQCASDVEGHQEEVYTGTWCTLVCIMHYAGVHVYNNKLIFSLGS